MDPLYSSTTCFQVDAAGNGFRNLMQYMSDWTKTIDAGNSSSDPLNRPIAKWLWNGTTIATGSWLSVQNHNISVGSHTVVVNNFSLALPHPSLLEAALDPTNGIVQPQELQNRGSYSVRAAIPSPELNTLCVTMTKADLKPLVYELWDDVSLPVNMSIWPDQLSYADPYLGHTPLHAIFQWGEEYGSYSWPPVFGKLPISYNTLVNDTSGMPYGRTTLYILARSEPVSDTGAYLGDTYALCQLQGGLTPFCSTNYTTSSSGSTLGVLCNDTADDMQYDRNLPTANTIGSTFSPAWPNIASLWARGMLQAATYLPALIEHFDIPDNSLANFALMQEWP